MKESTSKYEKLTSKKRENDICLYVDKSVDFVDFLEKVP